MPWPFVPPDPDLPNPVLASRSNPAAAWIELSGMDPHVDQPSTLFRVDGYPASVWVPHARGGTYAFAGVLIADRFQKGGSLLKAEWAGAERAAVKTSPIKAEMVDDWPANIDLAVAQRRGDRHGITVRVSVAKGQSAAQLIVAPVAYKMPPFATHADYRAAGTWAELSGRPKIEVEVPVTAGVTRYALFVARGFPKGMRPMSPVHYLDV